MYILKKTLPFVPDSPFYAYDTRPVKGAIISPRFGTFKRYRAKIFRWWIHAWFVNLWFKGEIEKIHITL